MSNTVKSLLFIIVLLAAFLRFWHLDTNPPSLYWDEVSQGYNAYSILKTGYDEHHEFFPIVRFQAFGDYKAPVSIYLDVASIALFGKNTIGIRFPSAFFGVLTVLFVYFLVVELFFKNESKHKIGLIASFILAIQPWHILLSRAAFEANIATFFTVFATYLFLFSCRKKSRLIIVSIVSFVFAFYSFNAHRVFIPLFFTLLCIVYYKDLYRNKKNIIIAGIFGIILITPFISYLRTPESRLRFNEVNIFSNPDIVKQSNSWIAQDDNAKFFQFIDNRRVLFALSYLQHYVSFFNPHYLFFTGDVNPRFSTRDNGELYLWELPFLLGGVFVLLKNKSKTSFIILGWFLLAPVAAATAREVPHALRSETFIPTYEIVASLGIVYFLASIKTFLLKAYRCIVSFWLFVVIIFLYTFLHNYFVHYPVSYSYDWQYGYKEAVQEVEAIKENYDYVVFTQTYGRPYIYVLLYGNVEPSVFWKDGIVSRDVFGFYTVSAVGKYIFRNNIISQDDNGKKVLYVAAPKEIPNSYKIIKSISFLNGDPAFVIASR